MRPPSIPQGCICGGLIVLLLAAPPLAARSLHMQIARLAHVEARAEGLALDLTDGAAPALQLRIDRLEVPLLALDGRVEWHCEATDLGGAQECRGPLRVMTTATTWEGEVGVRWDADSLRIELRQGERSLHIDWPLHGGAPTFTFARIPADWMKMPLRRFWPGGVLRSGEFDGDLRLGSGVDFALRFGVRALGLSSSDGTVSAENLAGRGEVLRSDDGRFSAVATVEGGRLRAGALDARLPDAPVAIALEARSTVEGQWDIHRFAWSDPGVLQLEASAKFTPAALAPLQTLEVRIDEARFPEARRRYLDGLFAAAHLAALELRGPLSGRLGIDAHGVDTLLLRTTGAELRHAGLGLAVKGLRGGIDWARSGTRPATPLAWSAAHYGNWQIGATRSKWRTRDGAVESVGALDVDLPRGNVRLHDVRIAPFATAGEWLSTAFSARGLGYDSADGNVAAANLALRGHARLAHEGEAQRVRVEAEVMQGEALVTPFYLKFPATPVQWSLDAVVRDAHWRIDTAEWIDRGMLELHAAGELDLAAEQPVHALRVDIAEADLATVLPRYLQGWLAARGFGELAAQGQLRGSFAFDSAGLQRARIETHALSVHDGQQRFAISGLEGGIDWDAEATRPPTTLAWTSAELYALPFGSARVPFAARAGHLALQSQTDVGLLGGRVQLEKLVIEPRSPRGERVAASFAVVGLDMAKLSEKLGWPRFSGNLSGGVPEIELVGDRIAFNGGLDLYVFGGHVGVSGMAMERPFGVAPSLSANVHFEGLDLDPLTGAFSFGRITGLLDGSITGLRLVDWKPVALDAALLTRAGGRMSYKAVDDLASIGGGGLAGGLQSMALRVFDTFGYRRIGLRCRLRESVCTMGGIDPVPGPLPPSTTDPAGYTIVEGAGLPRVTVVGHRRRVDWPTLIARLRDATTGAGPLIQ